MPLKLLDGVTASVDIMLGTNSLKCVAGSLAVAFERDLITYSTFCSGGYKIKIPSLKDIKWVISRMLSSGAAYSKFGMYHLSDTPVAFVGQFDTGCSISCTSIVSRDAATIATAVMSGGTIEGESSSNDVTVAWVVA